MSPMMMLRPSSCDGEDDGDDDADGVNRFSRRELKEMNDWLHDLLTNCTDLVITQVIDWIQYQTERASG